MLFFDHGAPYFSVSDMEVMGVVRSWEARGLVSEWQVPFGSFDQSTGKFVDFEKVNPKTCRNCLVLVCTVFLILFSFSSVMHVHCLLKFLLQDFYCNLLDLWEHLVPAKGNCVLAHIEGNNFLCEKCF